MKKIPLTQGYEALVDDEDFEWLNQWKWYAFIHKKNRTVYAMRMVKRETGRYRSVLMHRLLLNPPSHLQIDHMDGNGLNNQRSNLRIVTHQENQKNRPINLNNTSGVKGVYWSKAKRRWHARIKVDSRYIHLGYYHSLYTAAKVRKEAEIKYGFFDRESLVLDNEKQNGTSAASQSNI